MKTNKSFTKRLKVSKNGKITGRRPGKNHFNAKESRSSQINGKVGKEFRINAKSTARFLPGLVK